MAARRVYNPDRGYAWAIVAACFAINFVMAGLARVAGVLYIALIDAYGVSREAATAPFSLRFCVRNLSGPLVGVLGQRFGIRPIVLLGGIVSCVGGMVCAVAPDITVITIAWGGIHGLGYGMSNLIHQLMITRYFSKYRGVATGIALTGDCVGAFLLPIILEYLLCAFGLEGTFLILAGMSLNIVPAAMLLRAPPWETREPKSNSQHFNRGSDALRTHGADNIAFEYESNLKEGHTLNENRCSEKLMVVANVSDRILWDTLRPEDNELHSTIKHPGIMSSPDIALNAVPFMSSFFTQADPSTTNQTSSPEALNAFQTESRRKSALPTCEFIRKNSQLSVLSCPSAPPYANNSVSLAVPKAIDCLDPAHFVVQGLANPTKPLLPAYEVPAFEVHDTTSDALKAVFPKRAERENITFPFDDTPSRKTRDKIAVNNLSTESSEPSSLWQFIKTNTKPIFLLIGATMALYVFMFIAVFTIIIDYAMDRDIPYEYGNYLLVAFSLTDTAGRLGFGVVLDRQWIALARYAGLTTGMMGLFIFIMPFSTSLSFWMVSFGACGFVQGGCAIMYPILIQQYMEKDEETVAMGSLNFYGGLLMLPIPPMIGYFRDVIGTYDGVFWTTGGLCILVGCLWILEPCLLGLNRTKEISKDINCDAKQEDS